MVALLPLVALLLMSMLCDRLSVNLKEWLWLEVYHEWLIRIGSIREEQSKFGGVCYILGALY